MTGFVKSSITKSRTAWKGYVFWVVQVEAAYFITAMRSAIEAEGSRLLFDKTGAAAGIARRDALIDPSALTPTS